MADIQQAWIETLRRESGIRRAIILHGEILDVYPSPRNNLEYVPIQPIVCTTLRSKGFSDIILWDTFEGVKNIRPARWEDLQKGMISSKYQWKVTILQYSEYPICKVSVRIKNTIKIFHLFIR